MGLVRREKRHCHSTPTGYGLQLTELLRGTLGHRRLLLLLLEGGLRVGLLEEAHCRLLLYGRWTDAGHPLACE